MTGIRARASQETFQPSYTTRPSFHTERDTRYYGASSSARPSFDAYGGSSARQRTSHEQNGAWTDHNRPSLGTSRLSMQHESPPVMSPALSSMLKTTTETGDLGMYSIQSTRQTGALPRSKLPQQVGNPSRPLRSLNNRYAPTGTPPSDIVDDRRRLPSYMRDTTSEIVSMYQTAEQKAGNRSFSMTQPGRTSYATPKHHRSYTSLRSQAESVPATRPGSPYAYPSRLRRPGYRPSSPAFTDSGSIDHNRRMEYYTSEGQATGRSSPARIYGRRRRLPPPPLSSRSDIGSSSFASAHYPSPRQDGFAKRAHEQTRDWAYRGDHAFGRASPVPSIQSSVSLSNIHQVNGVPVSRVVTPGRGYEPPPLYYDYSEEFVQPQHSGTSVNDSTITPTFDVYKTIPEDHEVSTEVAGVIKSPTDKHGHPNLNSSGIAMQDRQYCPKFEVSTQAMGGVCAPNRDELCDTEDVPQHSASTDDMNRQTIMPQTPRRDLSHRAENLGSPANNPIPSISQKDSVTDTPAISRASLDRSGCCDEVDELSPSVEDMPQVFDNNSNQLVRSDCADICESAPLEEVPPQPMISIEDETAVAPQAIKDIAPKILHDDTEHALPRSTSAQDCRVRSSRIYSSNFDPAFREFATMMCEYETADDFDASKILRSSRWNTGDSTTQRNTLLSASLIKFRSEENLRVLRREASTSCHLHTVVDVAMIKREIGGRHNTNRFSARSETPLIAPKAISPERQLRLKTSIPRLMKSLPLLPPHSIQSFTANVQPNTQDVSHLTMTGVQHPATSLLKRRRPTTQLHSTRLEPQAATTSDARPSAETRPWNVKENYTWMAMPDVHLDIPNGPKESVSPKIRNTFNGQTTQGHSVTTVVVDHGHRSTGNKNYEIQTTDTLEHDAQHSKSTIDRMFRSVGKKFGNAARAHFDAHDGHQSATSRDVRGHSLTSLGGGLDHSQISNANRRYDKHMSQPLSHSIHTVACSRFSEDSLQARPKFRAPFRSRLSRLRSRLDLTHKLDTVFKTRRHDMLSIDGELAMDGAASHPSEQPNGVKQGVEAERLRSKMRSWLRETRAVMEKYVKR